MNNEFEEEMMNEEIINAELNEELINESEEEEDMPDFNLDDIEDYVQDKTYRELTRTLTDEELNSLINNRRIEKEKLLQENLHKYYHHIYLCKKCSRKFGMDETVTVVNRFLCPICDPPRKNYSSLLKRNSLS